MAHASGFSLLELIIALSIASILAGIGVLSHSAIRPTLDLSLAARQVAMDLQVTRMRAVATNVNHRLVFKAGTTGYQPQYKNGSDYLNEGAAVALPRGVTIAGCTATGSAIGFRPRGNAATFGTITIQNEKGHARHVVVDIAGQVRVEQ